MWLQPCQERTWNVLLRSVYGSADMMRPRTASRRAASAAPAAAPRAPARACADCGVHVVHGTHMVAA